MNKLHMKFDQNLFSSLTVMHKQLQTTPVTLADQLSVTSTIQACGNLVEIPALQQNVDR
jgi:hypothetical protein